MDVKYLRVINRDQCIGCFSCMYACSRMVRNAAGSGKAANVRPLSLLRGLPTRNFSEGSFEGADAISGERFARDFLVQHTACAHCQCGCIHMAQLREEFGPWHYSTNRTSYDYELIYAMGSMLGLSSPEEILKLLLITEKQGWDVISLGCTLAWATESFSRGSLSKEALGGLSPAFGDGGTYYAMLERIAAGEGELFRDLEKGCAVCAEKWGGADWAIQYGGVEPGGYMTGENYAVACLMGVRHSHLDDFGAADLKVPEKMYSVETTTGRMDRESLRKRLELYRQYAGIE